MVFRMLDSSCLDDWTAIVTPPQSILFHDAHESERRDRGPRGAAGALPRIAIWTPLTFDTTAWYFGRTAAMLVLLAGLGVYAFATSLGRKPMFGSALLEDGAPAGR
jgi:hypothetical protein